MLCDVMSCYGYLHLSQISQHSVKHDSFWRTLTMLAILYLFCYKYLYVYMLMGRKVYCIVNKILNKILKILKIVRVLARTKTLTISVE